MESSYDISGGSTQIELNLQSGQDIVGLDVISDSALDAAITIKLMQTFDDINFNDMPEVPITTDAGENTNLLRTNSFLGGTLYLDIDVMTATLGTLTLETFGR